MEKIINEDVISMTGSVCLSATRNKEIQKQQALIREDNMIPAVTDLTEMIALMNQVMYQHEPYHIEQCIAALIQLHPKIEAEHIVLIEVVLQRAYKLVMRSSSKIGVIDCLLSVFLIEYGQFLKNIFPDQLANIDKYHNIAVKEDQKRKKQYGYSLRICDLQDWECPDEVLYHPYKHLLTYAIGKVKTHNMLPLLSTPTHAPAWIDPVVLIERLAQYQAAGVKPDKTDWQIAISRTASDHCENALAAAKTQLSGKYQDLMIFLLDKNSRPPQNLKRDECDIWMTTALTKSPDTIYSEFDNFPYTDIDRAYLTGRFLWEVAPKGYLTRSNYDRNKKELEKQVSTYAAFQINIPKNTHILVEKYPLLVTYFAPTIEELLIDPNDIKRLMFLMPNHPDTFLARIIPEIMRSAELNDASEQVIAKEAIAALHELNISLGEMGYIFLASGMLSVNKTVRGYATKIWVEQVDEGRIDSERIGAVLGIFHSLEWAPIARLVKFIQSDLMHLSCLHDMELEKMLTACICSFPDKPVKNLKTILYVYQEVLHANHSVVSNIVAGRLKMWQKARSAKKTPAHSLHKITTSILSAISN